MYEFLAHDSVFEFLTQFFCHVRMSHSQMCSLTIQKLKALIWKEYKSYRPLYIARIFGLKKKIGNGLFGVMAA